jgi:hypothetical protein
MYDKTEIVLSNGDKCIIYVRFNDLYKQLVINDVDFIPKGKRKKESYNFNDDMVFRRLNSFEERYQYKLKKYLEHPHLTKEHLLGALNKTWESLKPSIVILPIE